MDKHSFKVEMVSGSILFFRQETLLHFVSLYPGVRKCFTTLYLLMVKQRRLLVVVYVIISSREQ